MSRVAPRILALAALLLLAVVAARGAASFALEPLRMTPFAPPTTTAPPTNTPPPQLGTGGSLAWLSLLLGTVGLLLVVSTVIALLSLIRLRRRTRTLVAPHNGDQETEGVAYGSLGSLVQAGKRALVGLRAREGGPPSDRVIAAWLALEEAATETGTGRQPHETPTEFTGAVLAGHDVNPGALDDLRRLYGRARFGRAGAMTDADAEAAGDALDRIIADLEAAR
ncbi:DUF4129 domain-containing protein [Kutzneria sp. CA-103260]|uniref:DUF4129 domain-containing protein n=1 Tax=Kutzneria sp. CA-103260 TaxID=2802641 RepID=UPI001BA5DF5C|nr:DUF4129 domain-containing protein [Kutzneria sp. CA-103260]QUQ72267.1 hypothetical protein JJ691_100550 [Kutzneria sp. CA-103260]